MPDPISWEHSWPFLLGALASGYLLGSIPFGLVLTRMLGMGDIREIGSGNIGATNVLRTGRKGVAAATLLLDGGKGAAAVLLAAWYGVDTAILAGLGAVLGHMFPIWLAFRGGKAVATTIGVWLALAWPVALLVCATWLAVAALTRYSSLAGLLSIAASAGYARWLVDAQHFEIAVVISALVWIAHRQNIARLLRGQESRIGQKSGPPNGSPGDEG